MKLSAEVVQGLGLGGLLCILLIGIAPLVLRRRNMAAVAEFAAHAFASAFIVFATRWFSPILERSLQRGIPAVTATKKPLFQFCETVSRTGMAILLCAVVATSAAEACIFYFLQQARPEGRLHKYWSLTITLMLFLVLAALEVTVVFPVFRPRAFG